MRVLALAAIVVGCRGVQREAGPAVDSAAGAGIAGAWDASLSLTSPYPLGRDGPSSRRICGTIGFVDNHHGRGSLVRSAQDIGVYDLDLARLGLDWIDDDSYPTAVATPSIVGGPSAGVLDRDDVTIVLKPGSAERIVLLGRHDALGIDGKWLAQSLRGTASGFFSLRPHGRSAPAC
jgi:hypothetical protein